jgi:hypothetical protein
MDIRNFHYINEPRIDSDFAQLMGSLITEITSGTSNEWQKGVEGDLSLGSLLEVLGLKLGIKADIRNRRINEEEVKQQLTVPNKLAIVEGILKKQNKLLSVPLLDISSIDEQSLVEKLRSSRFCLLSGKFTISEEIKGDRKWVLFSKGLGSHIILIAASSEFMISMRVVDFLQYRKPSVSAFCYYSGSSSDLAEQPLTTHIFHPRAIWDYQSD